MTSGRLWGALGVLLAVVGLAVIAPEIVSTVAGGVGEDTGHLLFAVYGVGMVVAVLLTVAIIGPSLLDRGNGSQG
jgi:hypothetical protein